VNPYQYYDLSLKPFLFTGEPDERYPAMERVVGVSVEGETKAYPFSVLAGEPVVNDEVAEVPIVVLWGAASTASALDDPSIPRGRAVGVGVAYLRLVDGKTLTFESSGEDHIRDRETGSVWDLLGKAVSGPLKREELTPVIQANHFWFAWAAFNTPAPVYEGQQ
jgi:hypothetical protein